MGSGGACSTWFQLLTPYAPVKKTISALERLLAATLRHRQCRDAERVAQAADGGGGRGGGAGALGGGQGGMRALIPGHCLRVVSIAFYVQDFKLTSRGPYASMNNLANYD